MRIKIKLIFYLIINRRGEGTGEGGEDRRGEGGGDRGGDSCRVRKRG